MSDNDRWRTDPLYTISETARLADVAPITIRRWLYGYETPNQYVPPMLGDKVKQPLVSFLQLIEILVASKFRKLSPPIKTSRIRAAHDFASKEWGLEFPFASLKLEPLGGHILHRFEEEQPGVSLATLDTRLQQWTLPGMVIDTVHNLDFEHELAARWYPIGKDIPIVVDPRYNAGMPTIINRRVTTKAVQNRFRAGYDIQFIADDLKLEPKTVEDVIRYADKVTV